jgi:UDP-glucose 4-epimerase
VAVTGPTGDIGRAFLRACDRARSVGRVLGMARRPFDPEAFGLRKTEYRQGDVLDRRAVDTLVEAAAAGKRVQRLVYTSSVAAYGFHADNPQPLTEAVPARGSEEHYYSAQKAELEAALFATLAGSKVATYVFRPCVVAGPDALAMLESIPWPVRRSPLPVIPDPGTRFQLVHHDDVAAALIAATRGAGPPGIYNLAGPGELTARDLARELGWRSFPIPRATVSVASSGAGLPLVPARAQWLNAFRVPVLMSYAKARNELRWRPRHDAASTLAATVAAARERGVV